MVQRRWLRIIPVALLMYTIAYIDRTNVSLALDPKISTLMKDLFMDDRMKGEAAGIFFLRLSAAANSRRLAGVALERAEGHQFVPDWLGRLCDRLRVFPDVPAI